MENQFFKKRKFAVFNFTIYETTNKKGHYFMWNENEGKRESNEIETCLLKFINNISPKVKTLILYSDCSKLNSSPDVHVCHKSRSDLRDNLYEIYRTRSHTHGDNMHSTIESAAECGKVHWRNIVRLAKRGTKYKVNELRPDDFLDFKKMRHEYLINVSKADNGTPLNWKEVKYLEFQKNVNDSFFFKKKMWKECFHKIDLTNIARKGNALLA